MYSFVPSLAFFLLALNVQAQNLFPPPVPAAWPPIDQSKLISGALLTDPLVTSAMAVVQQKVPSSLLAVKPSTYGKESNVTYNDDPVKWCYWPHGLCQRNSDGNGYKADVTVCPQQNQWGLTYDDGPIVNLVKGVHTSDTADIRSHLTTLGVKATFFIVGSNAIQHPEEVQNSYTAGHHIAIHTWTHHPLTSLTNEQIVAELKYTEAIIYKAIGKSPIYFRPPYGDIDDRVRAIAGALGYRIAIWTTNPPRDTTDADQTTTAAAVATKIVTTVSTWFIPQPGFITLEHDIDPFTGGIAVQILQNIASQGSKFPLKVQSIGDCIGDTLYFNSAPISNALNSTSIYGTNSTGTTTGSSATKQFVVGFFATFITAVLSALFV